MAGISLEKFQRVNRNTPCPVCGRFDWCLIARDQSEFLCQRTPSGRRCGEAGWLHLNPDAKPAPYVPPKKEPPPDLTLLACELAQCLLGIDRLADDLGVSSESIRRLGVGWHHGHGATSWPMRWACGGPVHGIRYRAMDGRKFSQVGGREGIFLPSGMKRNEPLLVVTEGASDCAASLTIGLPAIGRPSAKVGHMLVLAVVRSLAPRSVILTADSEPCGVGIAETNRLASLLAGNTPARVHVWTATHEDKDLRCWVRNGGALDQFLTGLTT